MPRQVSIPEEALLAPHTFGIYDHFEYDKDIWTDTVDGSASVTAGTLFGGVCVLTTEATNNTEAVRASGAIFQFAADKPMIARARLKITEANTNDAAVLFGIQTDVNGDAIVDGGLTPATSSAYNACWFKPKDTLYWNNVTSVNGTATTTTTDFAHTSGSYQTLAIQYMPKASALAEITFWLDTAGGYDLVQSRAYQAHARTPAIRHEMTSLAGGVVGLVLAVKAGGANAEVLTVDYVSCYQHL